MFKTVCFIVTLMLISSSNSKSLKTKTSATFSIEGCNDFTLSGTTIVGSCFKNLEGTDSRTINRVRFDLNKCVGNNEGRLSSGSNFSNTCYNCSIKNRSFTCMCRNSRGGNMPNTVDLSNVIRNNFDGDMDCI